LVEPLAEREPVVAHAIEILDPSEEAIPAPNIESMCRAIRSGR
jgi:hypothetical protein